MTPGRLALLVTSPRVAPGLLSAPAWDLLRHADQVLTDDAGHPQRPALEDAGVPVTVVDVATVGSAALAGDLLDRAAAGASLVWLVSDHAPTGGHDAGLDSAAWGDAVGAGPGPAAAGDLGRTFAATLARRAEAGAAGLPELEIVLGSYDLPGARLLDLVAVMDELRSRCPWVQQQTHRSLVRYLIEEAYETVEAIEGGDTSHLREELGDLLFQVVFHARLAEEYAEGAWTIDDVTGDLVAKLIRRNPHVFGPAGEHVRTPAGQPAVAPVSVTEVENLWDQRKAEEKRRSSAVEGVPLALPALTLADKLLGRVALSGLGVRPAPLDSGTLTERPPTADRVGEALLAVVEVARTAGIDAEQALRDACRRYVADVRAAEARSAAGDGTGGEGAADQDGAAGPGHRSS